MANESFSIETVKLTADKDTFDAKGRAVIEDKKVNEFLKSALEEFGEVFISTEKGEVNVNCGEKCEINVFCRPKAL